MPCWFTDLFALFQWTFGTRINILLKPLAQPTQAIVHITPHRYLMEVGVVPWWGVGSQLGLWARSSASAQTLPTLWGDIRGQADRISIDSVFWMHTQSALLEISFLEPLIFYWKFNGFDKKSSQGNFWKKFIAWVCTSYRAVLSKWELRSCISQTAGWFQKCF